MNKKVEQLPTQELHLIAAAIKEEPIKRSPESVDYSLFIQHPSPDLQADPNYMRGREVISITKSFRILDDLDSMGMANGVEILPIAVRKLFKDAVELGHYRVELLFGETEYKLYRKFHEQAP